MKRLKKIAISLILILTVLIPFWGELLIEVVYAATTADVTVTATPAFVGIADNVTTYDFGTVAESSTTNMPQNWVGITNTSTVQTDITIAAVNATWTGGIAWTHSDTATSGADTVGLNSSNNTGAYNIVVQKLAATPQFIYENCPAAVSFGYELQLKAPTTFSDGVQKTNTVRITAAAG